jgi:hypothetical protein
MMLYCGYYALVSDRPEVIVVGARRGDPRSTKEARKAREE